MSYNSFRRAAAAVLCGGFAIAAPLLCTATQAQTATASSFQTLYNFTGAADGAYILKGVTLDAAGNAYGVAADGANDCADALTAGYGCGTLFQLSSLNKLTALTTFTGTNGATPAANLALRGNLLYSTTITGGTNNLGTLFKVKTDGTGFKLLYQFAGTDGANPETFPRFDSAGNLFGLTAYGGPAFTGPMTGFGVLFELTKAGTYIPQHDFSGGADGGVPSRLFMDKAGNLYAGTAVGGSCDSASGGCGVVFEFTPSTGVYQVLHTFSTLDGAGPGVAGFDAKGDILGVSYSGGKNGYGTVWKLEPNGSGGYKFVKQWDFAGGADGAYPYTPLLAKGVLYGVSILGPIVGSNDGFGVLWSFKTKKTGVVQLHVFSGTDGAYPTGTPVMNPSGALIGTTRFGGSSAPCTTTWGTQISTLGCGTIFSDLP